MEQPHIATIQMQDGDEEKQLPVINFRGRVQNLKRPKTKWRDFSL